MRSVPVIGFEAYSGVGKTTLIEKLLHSLKARGLRVAVIKHDAHDFEIDHPGKDSYRFTAAGADLTAITSGTKTAVILQRELCFSRLLSQLQDVDLILVEGYKNEPIPQIGICRKAAGKELPAPAERYIAIVTDLPELSEDVPQFGFEEIERLTEFLMKNLNDFTHFNNQGRARMVDVGEKPETERTAVAAANVLVSPQTLQLIKTGGMKKGDVLTVAQIAGIMGAKRTSDLIPMCHPVAVDGIDLELSLNQESCAVEIIATVRCSGKTGVEMEALTAVSTAALTVYDMCKAIQKDIVISDIRLLSKAGGTHGDYIRKEPSI